jgi:hypothetical protein
MKTIYKPTAILLAFLIAILPLPVALPSYAGSMEQSYKLEEADQVFADPDTGAPIANSDKPHLSAGSLAENPVLVAANPSPIKSADAEAAPVITIFYGDNQKFGNIGKPQRWVNILGNITNPKTITSLTYSLNGAAAKPLSIGPDKRRLASPGDFNVEIDTATLAVGVNQIVINAVDNKGATVSKSVSIQYQNTATWPGSYTANWGVSTNIQDIAQVVDGVWSISSGVLRPQVLGYDRLIAIGDVTWTDYEVTMPITIHGIDEEGFRNPSNGPGIGLLFRWQGHFTEANEQPSIGWKNFGALGWYHWDKDASNSIIGAAQLLGYAGKEVDINSSKPLQFNVPYIFKMSVQSVQDEPDYYRFKFWPAAQPEPATWNVEKNGKIGEPEKGSLMLVAHHVDASIGTVTVTPLSQVQLSLNVTTDGNGRVEATPPLTSTFSYGQIVRLKAIGNLGKKLGGWGGDISGTQNPFVLSLTKNATISASFVDAPPPTITVQSTGNGTAAVLPAKPTYNFGEQVTLLATPNVGYQFAGWQGDIGGVRNPKTVTVTQSLNVMANFATAVPPVSDDFNSCALNTNIWTFRDQVGDSRTEINGQQLRIVVPGTTDHNVWQDNNLAPRLMQQAANDDISVEVKFESQVTNRYQIQGLIFEQDENNFIRFDYYHDGATTRAYAVVFENGLPKLPAEKNTPITVTVGTDMYISVARKGNEWNAQYRSLDGIAWKVGVKFEHEMALARVGILAGNAKPDAANPPPAFTSVVDYFFLSNARITPEDGRPLAPDIRFAGDGVGTVAKNPNQTTYGCNEAIQLTATPNVGSVFIGWSGVVSGSTNPVSMTIAHGTVVTATFAAGDFLLTTNVNGGGTVARSPNKVAYNANETVTLTATPNAGWRFVRWEGGLTGSTNPAQVTMNANKQVTAVLELVDGAIKVYLPLVRK